MTPQEQELVEELFDRLAKLENSPRDPAAERVIADGLRRAPQATYALVQTALVQDEALKRANARIEELQAQLGGVEQAQQPGSFLDSRRDAVLGKPDPRSSVPTVRSQAQSSSTTGAADESQCHGRPSLRFGRFVSRHGRINGSGRDRRRAPAQQHPFDVRPACRPWRMNPDYRLHLDDASSDFDEPEAQRIELRDAPTSSAWASTRADPT